MKLHLQTLLLFSTFEELKCLNPNFHGFGSFLVHRRKFTSFKIMYRKNPVNGLYFFTTSYFCHTLPVETHLVPVKRVYFSVGCIYREKQIELVSISVHLPLKARSIRSLQAKDIRMNNILQRLQVGNLPPNIYLIENGILRRKIVEPTDNEFKPIVIPKSLVDHILMTAHNHGGHNGFPRMYAAIRHLYFWAGIKRHTTTL